MTPERLAEIKARAEAAPNTPIHHVLGRTTHQAWMMVMAAQHIDILGLLAEVERLRRELELTGKRNEELYCMNERLQAESDELHDKLDGIEEMLP